jgi:hypothetical protein
LQGNKQPTNAETKTSREDNEMKQNQTAAIIAIVVTVIFCGCPGVFAMLFGATSMFASMIPGADIDIIGSSDPRSATVMGAIVCLAGLIFVAIPIVIAVITLRRKAAPQEWDAPIPPPS